VLVVCWLPAVQLLVEQFFLLVCLRAGLADLEVLQPADSALGLRRGLRASWRFSCSVMMARGASSSNSLL
jgi:hypothetical protein